MKQIFRTALTVLLLAGFLMAVLPLDIVLAAFQFNIVERLSVANNGSEGTTNSSHSDVSSDGRYVVWESADNTIVAGDSNGKEDVFFYDRETDTVSIVSTTSGGTLGNGDVDYPRISADGNYVVFTFDDNSVDPSNLNVLDTDADNDVYRKNVSTGAIDLVTLNGSNESADNDTYSPTVSGDGNLVAFYSTASNLTADTTNGSYQVFYKNMTTGTIELVSKTNEGTLGDSSSWVPTIAAGGGFIVFQSSATNLGPTDTNGQQDIYIKDLSTGTFELVSVDSDEALANGSSQDAAVSSDGRYVVFVSAASNLVGGDTNGKNDIFLRDRLNGTTTLISKAADGTLSNNSSGTPRVTDDGQYVAFYSSASNLVTGDTNNVYDVFVVDTSSDEVTRVSTDASGTQGTGFSYESAISADGTVVTYSSYASDLVADDTNGVKDVFAVEANFDLVAPTLSAPEDASSSYDLTPTFNWSDVAVASGYTLQYSQSDTFSSPVEESGSASEFTPASDLALGTWYWRVNATDGVDTSEWSEVWSFTLQTLSAPTLTAPTNGLNTYDGTPTFDWDDVTDATGYVLQYGTDDTFTTTNEETLTESTFTPASDLAEGTYYWRVKATGDGIESAWSSEWNVTVGTLSADAFVITVQTDNEGSSSDTDFIIPTYSGETYDYNVDCDGDGSDDATGQTGSYTCSYSTAGTYTIVITNNASEGNGFPQIYFNGEGDKDKLLSVEQWGTGAWSSMAHAFAGCTNLVVNATDAPDLSAVTTMESMFASSGIGSPDLSGWDTSHVTNMAGVFAGATSFNGNITTWSTGNVLTMANMFNSATVFNQNISSWNTASVTSMTSMFDSAAAFNQPIGTWTTSSVTDMSYMFADATAFNQYVGLWNTGNVSNMNSLFAFSAFDQDISGWNTAKVTDMGSMFYTTPFDQDLSGWNVGLVTTMENMFYGGGLSAANYDALLTGWAAQTVQSEVNFHAGSSTYCVAGDAHQDLTDNDLWTITDGGQGCDFTAPTLVAPADASSSTDLTPTFDWDDVADATGYVLQYGTDNTFATTTTREVVDSTFTVSSNMSAGTYYWRARALGGSWSSAWSFTLTSDPYWSHEFGYGEGWENPETPRTVADVNGDGVNDLIGFGPDGVYIALGTGSNFEESSRWLAEFGSNPEAGGWGGDNTIRTAADVNGDGMADIVGFGDFGVMVSLSTGTSFGPASYWIYGYGSNPAMGGWSSTENNRVVADVNGDGMADVVGFADYGVLVSLSTGSSFLPNEFWVMGYGRLHGGWDGIQNPRMIADINADGCGDVVGFGDYGIVASISNACGDTPTNTFGDGAYWTYGYGYMLGAWDSTRHIRTFFDVDGDGDADVIGFGDYGVLVSLSDGVGTFGGAEYWIMGYGYVSGGWDVNYHPRSIADVNGDGLGDVVGYATGGVLVALSDGTKFE